MVNGVGTGWPVVRGLVVAYVVVTVATVAALVVLSSVAPRLATDEAWGHAVIVLVFAAVLPLRLRSARGGSRRALVAVTVIAAAVLVVNLVEAFVPAFPGWMRAEMGLIVVLMAALLAVLVRARRRSSWDS